MRVLEAVAVQKRFAAQCALDGIDLNEGPGCIAVVGANGAGKSTLLRLAATVLLPDQGVMRVAGFDTATQAADVRRAMTYLAPHMRLPARLTGREILHFTATAYGIVERSRIDAVIERFAIAAWLDRPMGGLSTGEHQRINLARALLPEPQVLLIDEPSTGLDLPACAGVRRDLAALMHAQRLIVLASHDPLEIAAVADRVLVLRHGRVAWRGALNELGSGAALAAQLEALCAESTEPLPC